MKGIEGRPTLATIEEAILALEEPGEVRRFLSAMLSYREHQQLRKRWAAYQLRGLGYTLSQIVRRARMAMATATRAAQLHRTSPKILNTILQRISAQRARAG